MTQLDTTAPAPAQAPVEAPAPAPAPAPAQPAESQQDWPRYDPARLKAAGYEDYHALLADGKDMQTIRNSGGVETATALRTLAQKHGWDDEKAFIAMLNEAVPETPQGTPEQAATETPQLDQEAFRNQIREDRKADWGEFQKQNAEAYQKQQSADTEQRAQQAKEDAGTKALEQMGFKKSGDRDYSWDAKHTTYLNMIEDAQLDSLPPNATDKDADAIVKTAATEKMLLDAAVALNNMLKDDKNVAVADFATKQQDVPSATAGEGPGGSKVIEKDYDAMSKAEQIVATTQHLKKS